MSATSRQGNEQVAQVRPSDLVLVDGSYYLFRAYHALPPLHNREGMPTGAIYGVINMLRRLKADYPSARIAVVFDPRGKTFRNTLDPNYKSNRPPTPEDLSIQVPPLQELIQTMGLPLLCVEGEEADDVIATLARRAEAAGMQVLVATGDKDLAQLVGPCIRLLDTMKNKLLDAQGVEQKFGVPPAAITDYLALIGDAVDNVPGVPSVGPKTACKWLQGFGSLDAIIAGADEIKGKPGEKLRSCLEQLPLSKQLVTLRDKLQLPFGLEALEAREPDVEALTQQLQRLGFNSWLKTLREETGNTAVAEVASASPPAPMPTARILQSESELAEWAEQLRAAGEFALWVETEISVDMHADLAGIGFATEAASAYLPLRQTVMAPLTVPADWAPLRAVLEDAAIAKRGHRLKYAMNVLGTHGITLRGIIGDSMLASYVHDSTAPHDELPGLCNHYLDETAPVYEELVGKGAKRISFSQVEPRAAAAYAAGSAAMARKLLRYLDSMLAAHKARQAVYRELELPLVPVLSTMERNGVLIDPAQLAEQGRELAGQLRELEEQAHVLVGREFNLGSPQQLRHVLFDPDGLGLPVGGRTPKGEPSTAEDVLHNLATEHELPRLILRHRMLDKLRNTYVDKLPTRIYPGSGRVHTVYHQAGAVTGRLSSSAPNLQNIPVRTPEGRRIRRAFIAPPGCLLLTADYSQIELRIMAHLSADERLCAAFANGEDVHVQTAAEIFDLAPAEVDNSQRRAAKAINFGLIYGMSAYGLARQLDIEAERARQYMDRYFERYHGVREYMERVRAAARKQGWVETLYGRRLYLPELKSKNGARRRAAERAAINAPMQGTAADIMKRAMIDVHRWLEESSRGARMVMQVHDELVFEVAEERVNEVGMQAQAIMAASGNLDIPLGVAVGSGPNWDTAH